MTLQQLAQKVGTTAQTIQRLETDNMTVSLDWLQRIGVAFGVPAAALIVSETTASVQVLGHVDATGEVTPAGPDGPATLSLVIAAPSPVAVRVTAPMASFEGGTLLIGNKIDFDPDILAEARDCLVALKSGRMVFRRVTTGAGGTSLTLPHTGGLSDAPPDDIHDPANIEWIAPILMAVRYF